MSRQLVEIIERYLVENGSEGKARLCLAAGRGEQMIDRYRKGRATPPATVAFKLALACGLTKEEALEIVRECPSEARETA